VGVDHLDPGLADELAQAAHGRERGQWPHLQAEVAGARLTEGGEQRPVLVERGQVVLVARRITASSLRLSTTIFSAPPPASESIRCRTFKVGALGKVGAEEPLPDVQHAGPGPHAHTFW
jgi:hypothetical protein